MKKLRATTVAILWIIGCLLITGCYNDDQFEPDDPFEPEFDIENYLIKKITDDNGKRTIERIFNYSENRLVGYQKILRRLGGFLDTLDIDEYRYEDDTLYSRYDVLNESEYIYERDEQGRIINPNWNCHFIGFNENGWPDSIQCYFFDLYYRYRYFYDKNQDITRAEISNPSQWGNEDSRFYEHKVIYSNYINPLFYLNQILEYSLHKDFYPYPGIPDNFRAYLSKHWAIKEDVKLYVNDTLHSEYTYTWDEGLEVDHLNRVISYDSTTYEYLK